MDIIYYTIAICFLLDVKHIAEINHAMDMDYKLRIISSKKVLHKFWYYVITFLGCALRIIFVYAILVLIDSFPFLIKAWE